MQDFKDRLLKALQHCGISQSELARRTGISQSGISRLTRLGKRTGYVTHLASALGVDAHWLATGQGPMLPQAAALAPVPGKDLELVWIPRYEVEASAGAAIPQEAATEAYALAFRQSWLLKRDLHPKSLSIITVGGDSMEPVLSDGDLILVDQNKREPAHGRAYVLRMGNELQVKYLETTTVGVRVVSANPRYPPYALSPEELEQTEIVGRVVISIHKW